MKGPALTKIALAELVEDFSIYPREMVDDVHVGDLANALRAGAKLPPPVVDRQSKRIVDGMHRIRAFRRVLGPEGTIRVELWEYDSELELFLDAARRNGGHGRKLSRSDQVRVLIIARRLGLEDESQVAVALSVPDERLSLLKTRILVGPGGDEFPSKHGVEIEAGTQVKSETREAIRHRRGINALRAIRELQDLVRLELVPLDEEKIRRALLDLVAMIQERLVIGS